jgi:hypothetical protein
MYRGADFILAGPVSLWLQGHKVNPKPYLVLVSSRESSRCLEEAISIGSEKVEWEPFWAKVDGRVFRLRLRGIDIAGLADPVLLHPSGPVSFKARDMAKHASVVGLGKSYLRLAPLEFEFYLWDVVGVGAEWLVSGPGRAARL